MNVNKKWLVLCGVSIASFLGCIDFTIVNTALPAIQSHLQATITQLQWIVNIFILALSTCMVIMGRLADIYGRRLVLYVGMIGFGLASLGAGFATNIDYLILFRCIQGMSCAILYTATGAIVANAFPANERGKAIGTLFGVNGVGLAVGPVLGGILVSALDWRWIFFINVPLITLSLLICFLSVDESRNEENNSIDWSGLLSLMIALPCLIVSIIKGEEWGWLSRETLSLFTLSCVMFAVFYWIENRVKSPIIQFHLFLNKTFLASIAATAALAFFYCVSFFLIPLYLEIIRGQPSYNLGLMLLPITATVAILSPTVGRIVDRLGFKIPLILGLGLFVTSAFIQSNFFDTNTSIAIIILTFILIGIGWACILGPSTVAALSSLPENMSAVAMGTSWTLHNMGGAIGLALGLVVYHAKSQFLLNTILSNYHISSDSLINQVILHPENGAQVLQQYTSLGKSEVTQLFNNIFLSGYHDAMKLLIFSSFIALMIVLFGVDKKRYAK